MRRSAALPLHGGKAPAWLFRRMTDLAGAIGTLIVRDFGPDELLRRLGDPFWFQAFGCVLGFDWHSSGVTTTVCGALKEAAKKCGGDLPVLVCGGKGGVSRKTPDELRRGCERTGLDADRLVRLSKLTARIDNAAVQDGFDLYHHVFFCVPATGAWCVVQQGMNEGLRYARRYHWLRETAGNLVSDPHAAVACDHRTTALNLVAGEGESHRRALTELAREHPDRILRELAGRLPAEPFPLFEDVSSSAPEPGAGVDLHLPARHSLHVRDLDPSSLRKVLFSTYEAQAPTFEKMLEQPGLGPKALRSLALIAELIYRAPASRRDPAAYSFAHGGKDGHPYHVDRELYDANIERLRDTIGRAKIGLSDRTQALRSLADFLDRTKGG